MKQLRITASVTQTLNLEGRALIERCPDKEFSYLDCVKIGDDYFLPSIEWTKYVPAEAGSGDDSGGFEPVKSSDWEEFHHSIVDERVQIKKA
ncbi:hypothetical protein HZ994_09515 [Akkermansiaceae bacterium]|nr:hypothetical protein HZ994_09515 [Akkermansiaceae bacterium]